MYNNTIPPPLVAVFIKYLNTILKNEVRYSIALLDIKTPSHICSK